MEKFFRRNSSSCTATKSSQRLPFRTQNVNLIFEILWFFCKLFVSLLFGPKRDEVTGEWGKMREDLNDLYSSPNIARVIKSRRMRWAWHVVRMGERRGLYRVLMGKPEGKRPLGRPRRRWEDNIEMDIKEVGCGCVDWIELGHDRDSWRALVNAVMNLQIP